MLDPNVAELGEGLFQDRIDVADIFQIYINGVGGRIARPGSGVSSTMRSRSSVAPTPGIGGSGTSSISIISPWRAMTFC